MTIEDAIILIEHEYIEEDIRKLSGRDRLNFWASLKEFERPKIQRAVFEPIKDDDIKIKIEYGISKNEAHPSIQKSLGKSTTD